MQIPRRRWAVLLLVLVPIASAACDASAGQRGDPTLEEVFAAVERYQDVNVALAEGFFRNPLDTCETPAHFGRSAELGVMGIAYLHRERLGITADETRLEARNPEIDFLRPGILFYEPGEDGSVELVGVAYLVSVDAWESGGRRGVPTFSGQPFHRVEADPSQLVPAHYDLHLWLRDNPSGPFAPYNPAVSCRHHRHVMPMLHPDGTGRMVMPEPHPHIRGLPLSEEGGSGTHSGHE